MPILVQKALNKFMRGMELSHEEAKVLTNYLPNFANKVEDLNMRMQGIFGV